MVFVSTRFVLVVSRPHVRLPHSCRDEMMLRLTNEVVEFQIKNGVYPEDMYKSVPLFRWGMPEEIAQAVVFLTSEKASFITGEELVVDGGSIIASH